MIICLIFFLVISILFIGLEKEEVVLHYHSSQLTKNTTKVGDVERTDYIDSNGKITFAADVGYATVVIKNGQGSKLEQYFDDQGEPVRRSSGYYAVLREYDDSGNNIRNTYLDRQGVPVVTLSGYAIEERGYNIKGQVISKKYYDAEGHPAQSISFEYGQINEYNEGGRIRRTIYHDASGNPVKTKNGYAIVSYKYYTSEGPENGKVESEFYFDEEGNPISLSLGEYGLHKKYDEYGRESVWTYLDEDGNPIVTKKGYTTVLRGFLATNYAAKEQYLDIHGNPFALLEGQYGVEAKDGHTVYLDASGKEQFNIKNLLYNRPRLIIAAAMIVVLLSAAFSRKWNLFFAVGYIIAIAYLTLLFRENDGATLKLEPFWSYRKIFSDSDTRADILKNIWLFIPLGAILYRIYPNDKVLLIPVLLSILIEAIQYFSGTGFCEIDDVISNGLGGAIGYGMGGLASMIRNPFRCKKIIDPEFVQYKE